MPARQFERYIGELDQPGAGPADAERLREGAGRSRTVFAESDDPERLVPVVEKAEDIMIAVSGDPLRTNAYVFAHNGILGYPTTKPIRCRRVADALREARR